MKTTSRFNPSCCMLFFDCPTDTPLAKKQLAKFKKKFRFKGTCTRATPGRNGVGWTLLRLSPEAAADLLGPVLPADGVMQIMPITEAQLAATRIFWGAMRKSASDMVAAGAK